MSDITEAETEETKVDFEHYVQATKELVGAFRDELAEHTAELTRTKIDLKKGASVELPIASHDPQHHAELHRIRIACDNFINALHGAY